MLDADILKFRSDTLQQIRSFFISRDYMELDTPAMSPVLPPDTACEVFSTAYDDPWTGEQKKVFLLPTHRYFLSKALAGLKAPLFQLSKCYRNGECADSRTSPEFTLLEAYSPDATPEDAAQLTETLLNQLISAFPSPLSNPFFLHLSLDEACLSYAGFSLSGCKTQKSLAKKLNELGVKESASNRFRDWAKEELFELLLTQCIVPALPRDRFLLITDWPSFRNENWMLYTAGTELAVSPRLPEENGSRGDSSVFSVIEMNIDRLVMLLSGKNSIENVIPFPFRLKKGYY